MAQQCTSAIFFCAYHFTRKTQKPVNAVSQQASFTIHLNPMCPNDYTVFPSATLHSIYGRQTHVLFVGNCVNCNNYIWWLPRWTICIKMNDGGGIWFSDHIGACLELILCAVYRGHRLRQCHGPQRHPEAGGKTTKEEHMGWASWPSGSVLIERFTSCGWIFVMSSLILSAHTKCFKYDQH